MENFVDIFPKLTRISNARWNESRVVYSFSFKTFVKCIVKHSPVSHPTFLVNTSINCYKLPAFCLSLVLRLKDHFQPSEGSKHVCDHAWERIDSLHLFLWTITIASALMQTTLCIGLLTGILAVCLVQLQVLLSDCYGRTLQLQHILANF